MNRHDRRRLAKHRQHVTPVIQLAATGMQEEKPQTAFAAADALAFLAVHPRSVKVPAPAAPALHEATPQHEAKPRQPKPSPPAEDAYAPADKASYRHLETAAYFRALDAARSAKAAERLAAVAAAVHALADEVWTSVRAEAEPAGGRSQIACASGCGACCHQLVAIAPAEAAAIARFVDQNVTPQARAEIIDRVRALDTATRGKTAIERARLRLPCAFLERGSCSIYAARPLRCRAVHSRDAGHCGWALVNPDAAFAERGERAGTGPFLVAPAKIMDAALTGLARACRTLGVDGESLELAAAARIALAVPELEQHIAAGEPVFAAAALPGAEPDVRPAMPAGPPSEHPAA